MFNWLKIITVTIQNPVVCKFGLAIFFPKNEAESRYLQNSSNRGFLKGVGFNEDPGATEQI